MKETESKAPCKQCGYNVSIFFFKDVHGVYKFQPYMKFLKKSITL